MSTLERARERALAIKIESTAGTDAIAGTPATADWVDAAFSFSPSFIVTPDPSYTGSLDPLPGDVGGGMFTMSGVQVPIRGSGTAGTAPDWFQILRAAGMVGTDTAAAVGAPTAATAGSAVTATLQTPFAATADLYLGMPLTLAGNPSTARTVLITQYTAGRVARLSRTFSPVLDTSTTAQIPINNLLELSDTASDWPRLTIYAYQAGRLHIGLGCVVLNPRIRLTAAGRAVLEFDVTGQLSDSSGAEIAVPAGAATVTRPSAPIWRNGECQIGLSTTDRALLRAAEAVLSLGTSGMLPPNPEAANGMDPAEIMARRPTLTLTAMANSTASAAREVAIRTNADCMFSAILGSTAGNRIGILFSPGRMVSLGASEREGADVDTIALEATTPGRSVMISAF